MFHVKRFAFVLFISCLYITGCGQSTYRMAAHNQQVPMPMIVSLWDSLMKQSDIRFFSKLEQEAIYCINLARQYPELYRDSVVLPYLKANPRLAKPYGNSLVQTLGSMHKVGVLLPYKVLANMSELHAKDLMKQGTISHNSADGRTMQERFRNNGISCGSECVHYSSFPTASEMILSLLIDYGVSGLGHRKALLSAGNRRVGVGVERDKAGINYMVVNMSCE